MKRFFIMAGLIFLLTGPVYAETTNETESTKTESEKKETKPKTTEERISELEHQIGVLQDKISDSNVTAANQEMQHQIDIRNAELEGLYAKRESEIQERIAEAKKQHKRYTQDQLRAFLNDISTMNQDYIDQEQETIKLFNSRIKELQGAIDGDPVLVASGEYIQDEIDIQGLLPINRFYSSRSTMKGVFGKGRASIFDVHLEFGINLGYEALAKEYKELAKYLSQQKDSYISQFGHDDFSTDLESKISEYTSEKEYYESKANECFGKGTQLNIGSNKIILFDQKGYPILFQKTGTSIWTPQNKQCNFKSLTKTGNQFLAEHKNGDISIFSDYGVFLEKQFRNGNTAKLVRNSNGQIIKIENTCGSNLEITWNNGLIESILEVDSDNTFQYSYTNLYLTTLTDFDGDTTHYSYSRTGYLTKVTKPDNSQISLDYETELQGGILLATKTTNEEGFSEYFNYDVSNKITTYINMDGDTTVYYYDSNYHPVKIINPAGVTTSFTYDQNGNLKSECTNGYTTTYSYNENGYLCSKQSGSTLETYTWNAYGDLLSYTDGDGIITQWTYDNKGNLLQTIKGSQTVFTATYDDRSNITNLFTVNEDKSLSYSFKYDEKDNCIERTCNSQKENWTYEKGKIKTYSINDITVLTYEYGNKYQAQTNLMGLKTEYFWNNRKDLSKVSKTDIQTGKSYQTTMQYDHRHKMISINTDSFKGELRYTGSGEIESTIIYDNDLAYITWYKKKDSSNYEEIHFSIKNSNLPFYESQEDSNLSFQNADLSSLLEKALEQNRIITQTIVQPGNKTLITQVKEVLPDIFTEEKFLFYPSGNLEVYTNALGENFQCTYSAGGRLQKYQNDFGGFVNLKYDYNGDLVQNTEDSHIFTEYDALGRTTKITVGKDKYHPDVIQTFTYSPDGRTITKTDGDLYKTTIILDAFGNILSETSAKGNTKQYQYDEFGNCTAVIDPYGAKTEYEYNVFMKISRIIYPNGSSWTYSYDLNGNCTKIQGPEANLGQFQYDYNGNLVWEKTMPGIEKRYSYDSLGRPISVDNGEINLEKYKYSPYGRTVTWIDGNGNSMIFEKNEWGLLEKETNRLGDTAFYYYDSNGQLNRQIDYGGNQTSTELSNEGLTRTVVYADGSRNVITRNYADLITEIKNNNDRTTFEYDLSGRLVFQKNWNTMEETYYSYDSDGNRSRRVCKNQEIIYRYNKNNQLSEINDLLNRTSISFTYDSCGKETSRIFGNGNSQLTFYDKNDRINLIVLKDARGEILWGEGYVYNQLGQREITVRENGQITMYRYNKQGNLVEVLSPPSKELEEKLMTEANSLGIKIDDKTTCFENVLLSSGELENVKKLLNRMNYGRDKLIYPLQIFIRETYSYDRNFNRILRKNRFFQEHTTYDKEDRPVSIRGLSPNSPSNSDFISNNSNSIVQFYYNKNGNLVMKRSLSEEIHFSYNYENRMISSTVKGNNTLEETFYGYDALGRRTLVSDSINGTTFTLYEGTGFTRIKEGPVTDSGLFTDIPKSYASSSKSRYLSPQWNNDEIKSNSSLIQISSRNSNFLWPLEKANSIYAVSSDTNTFYTTTDIQGSTRFAANSWGITSHSFDYDTFGNPLSEDVTGPVSKLYAGKPYNASTSLYDYGYRDYQPSTSTFTTTDPVRDGTNWYSYCNSDPVNYVDFLGLEIFYYVYRDPRSYVISTDRDHPINMGLDVGVLFNSETGEKVVFTGMQTVANYPSTDGKKNPVSSCYEDTIVGSFELKLYTTTSVAPGPAGVLTNAKTLDGRKVDAKGYTQGALSAGRGLQHSNINPENNKDYNNKFSKQCFILSGKDNKLFFNVLKYWGVKDKQSIKGYVYEEKYK